MEANKHLRRSTESRLMLGWPDMDLAGPSTLIKGSIAYVA